MKARERNEKRLKELEGKEIGQSFWDTERTPADWNGIMKIERERRIYKALFESLFDQVAFTTIPDLDILRSKTLIRKKAIGEISDGLKNFLMNLKYPSGVK
jgi:hypothetical protein